MDKVKCMLRQQVIRGSADGVGLPSRPREKNQRPDIGLEPSPRFVGQAFQPDWKTVRLESLTYVKSRDSSRVSGH